MASAVVNATAEALAAGASIGLAQLQQPVGSFERFWRHLDANYTHFHIGFWGPIILHQVVYLLLTGVSLTLASWRGIQKFKLQPSRPVTREQVIQCLKLVFWTHAVVESPLYLLLPVYMGWTNTPFHYDAIPHWSTYTWKIALAFVMEDSWHYWAHRFLHWKPLYPLVHKIHHTYTAPFGIVAEYAHPVETIVLGFGFFIPMLTLCDHMLFMFVWFLARQVQTHEAHIGFEFPYNPLYLIPFYGGARAHDLHHSRFECNYASTFTYWDKLCGTYVPPASQTKLALNPNASANGNGNGNHKRTDVSEPDAPAPSPAQ